MNESQERLAKLGPQIRKTSVRDLPLVLSQRINGATTVSATMHVAHMAGIEIFVTGGIGGVHRYLRWGFLNWLIIKIRPVPAPHMACEEMACAET